MKIREIKAKSIITKTGLEADFVINPYVGCLHGCLYCYARFMKKFTGHREPWGSFLDIKVNAPALIPTGTRAVKYKGKSIIIGSVTDAYQPMEKKYRLTRQILEKLIAIQPSLDIITKSDLVLRDIDLLKQFKNCLVAVSLSILNEKIRRELEPAAPSAEIRINALRKLHQAGIKTGLFVSPILPGLTDWPELIRRTKGLVDEYWFENFNPYPLVRRNIDQCLEKKNPRLLDKFRMIYRKDDNYWAEEEQAIRQLCQKDGLVCRIYFHH